MRLRRTFATLAAAGAASAALALATGGVAEAMPARPTNTCNGLQGSLHTITHYEFDLDGSAVGETAFVCVYWNNGEGTYESMFFDKDGSVY